MHYLRERFIQFSLIGLVLGIVIGILIPMFIGGGGSSTLTQVSSTITPISGGFQEYDVSKDSDSNQYRYTFTFQKQ